MVVVATDMIIFLRITFRIIIIFVVSRLAGKTLVENDKVATKDIGLLRTVLNYFRN